MMNWFPIKKIERPKVKVDLHLIPDIQPKKWSRFLVNNAKPLSVSDQRIRNQIYGSRKSRSSS